MISNKKVLIVDFTNFYGGGQKFIENINLILKSDLEYFFAIADNKLFENLNSINSIKISGKLSNVLLDIYTINKFAKNNNVDYILLNGNRPIYLSFLFPFYIKKIAYKHTSNNAFGNIFTKFLGTLFLNFNYFFCNKIVLLYSDSINEVLFNKKKVKIIANPIIKIKSLLYNFDNNESDIFTVVVISRLDSNKGIDWIIDAFIKLLESSNKNAQLLIVGSGPEYNNLKSCVDKKFSNNIKFLGFIENVYGVLENADIFVLPSRFETFPLSIIEALSCGLPIVATKTGGLSELVINDTNGFLVDFGDTEKLISSIKRLMIDLDLRKKFSLESYNHYQNNYTSDVFKYKFLELFNL